MRTVLKEPRRQKKCKQSGLTDNFPSIPVICEFWKAMGNAFRRPLDVMPMEDTPGHYGANDPFHPEETYELPERKPPDIETLQAEIEGLKIQLDQANERANRLEQEIYELSMQLDEKKKPIHRRTKK